MLKRNYDKPKRFEKGSITNLKKIRDNLEIKNIILKIYIVQPGLSKKLVSGDILELLSTTQHFLLESSKSKLKVICSE